MTRNTIARHADTFARGTKLYRLTLIERGEPRNLRWWPLAALAALAAGYALIAGGGGLDRISVIRFTVGGTLFLGGFFTAFYLRFIGPRFYPDAQHRLDERERAIRARAGNIAFMAIVWLLMMGCFYASFASSFGWWMPRAPLGWIWLGLMIQGWANALPVLVASWLQPRLDADRE